MDLLSVANKLEGLLRRYLNCDYTEFGVKANDNLLSYDWKSPICFALGHKYAQSHNDKKTKDEIDTFLGNTLQGQNVSDLVDRYEYYGFDTKEDALKAAENIIKSVEKILFS